MIEIIGNAPDWATFAKAAAVTGQTDEHGHPVSGGPLATGGAWAYNAAGVVEVPTGKTITNGMGNPAPEMTPLPGVWARIRFNGEVPNLSQMIAAWRANGVIVYERINGRWTADGITAAPAYIDTIGVFA